jgi:hypothetical protein
MIISPHSSRNAMMANLLKFGRLAFLEGRRIGVGLP